MDEVENPDLPKAGEASPTLRPIASGGGDANDAIGASITVAAAAGGGGGGGGAIVAPEEAVEQEIVLDSIEPAAKPALPASRAAVPVPARPPLVRPASNPPPSQPPPAPPGQDSGPPDFTQEPPDSLTLADLKRIRSTFPNAQVPQKQQLLGDDKVYDFDYQDAQSFPVELEEWFSYNDEEEVKLRKCQKVFHDEWRTTDEGKLDWLDVTEDARRLFIKKWITSLQEKHATQETITKALMILTYVGLGIWEETAGRQEGCALDDLFTNGKMGGSKLEEFGSSSLQVQWIVAMIDTLHSSDGLRVIYDTLRRVCDRDFEKSAPEMSSRNESQARRGDESMDLWCCLTLMYLFVEVSRTTGNAQALKTDVVALEPSFLNYLTQIIARLRWDEYAPIPLTKMLLLAWKTILISLGGIIEVEKVKTSLRGTSGEEKDTRGQPLITASPLDYHLFRQEISSKYPAYHPPPPLFPLEPENNSILPPLKHRRPSYVTVSDAAFAGAPAVGTGSIMHQPVHIATPAPSPPPSPAGPGKAGKKQNYQTNQMFPFLYPPLDASSNDLGGKGSTELQDALVGRRWEGADIPTSILEAAELFAKRMRATRAMKQLWEARVDFMKQERGWKKLNDASDNLDVDDFELVPKPEPDQTAEQGKPVAQTEEQRRLSKVNDYYRDSLPHLQSVVIVLLKAVLQNVTDLVTKGNGQNGLQAGIQFNETNSVNGTKPVENGVHSDGIESTMEELDKQRSQEIAAKALSAILLLLLKWFKVSHILQYEYMTQLLLDSNYIPLILKLWQTQEIGRACHFELDREDRNFFYFCQKSSRQGAPAARPDKDSSEESDDDAAPPPIKLKREETPPEQIPSPTTSPPDFTHPPEIDELGYPQTPLPPSPLKHYSYRNVFSAINYLRVLQKVTRRKTHRALLLVSYKSSNHLKKTLKIPIQMLRYYTLKLFKSQVPFCGRKWRQGNMKIITAVWLSVPAELRDDWLSGGGGGMGGACVGDVDGTVEDALPLEQSLRALTHWWNVRMFPDVMGVEKGMLDEEQDYFARELEKMELVREEELAEEPVLEEPWQGPIEGY
ncbi:Factor arrest protein [Sphaerulina musiva]